MVDRLWLWKAQVERRQKKKTKIEVQKIDVSVSLASFYLSPAKAQRRKERSRLHKKLCAFAPLREKSQLPGVRGFALSPDAAPGSGGKLSPSFAEFINGVAPCRLTSSSRLNSA